MSCFTILMVCLFATGHALNQDEALAKLLLGLNPDAAFNPSFARSHLPASSRQARVPHSPGMVTEQFLSDMMIDAYEKELPGFRHYLENGMAKEVSLSEEFLNAKLPKDLTVAQAAENSGLPASTVEKLMKMISTEAELEFDKKYNEKMEALSKEMNAALEGMDEESDEYKNKKKAMLSKFESAMEPLDKADKEEAQRILALIEAPIAAASKDYKGPPVKIVPETEEYEIEDPAEVLKQFAIDDTVFDKMPLEAAKILDAYDGDKPKETLAELLKLFDPFEEASKA